MQLNYTIKFQAIKGNEREDEGKSAFFYWNFLGIPVFANNFMESKVRLNSVLEMYHCMEDCFCLGKQNGDRVALCLMCLLTSHSTFNSSQNVPARARLFWRFSLVPVSKLRSGYQAHTHTNTQAQALPGLLLLLSKPRETFILLFSSAQHSRAQPGFISGWLQLSVLSLLLPSLLVFLWDPCTIRALMEREQRLHLGELWGRAVEGRERSRKKRVLIQSGKRILGSSLVES